MVYVVKAMVFPVVMYSCENWTIKKAESWRIDVFELWCLRRLLRIPWTAKISNQSILKEINPKYSLEGLRLKLKLQYFGHLMWRAGSLEKPLILERLKAGRKGDDRGYDGWMASRTRWTWVWSRSRSWWRTGKSLVLQVTKILTGLSDWTELICGLCLLLFSLSGRFGILYLLPNLKISHWSNLMCLYVQCLGYLMGFVNTLFEQFPLIILRFHHYYFT